MSSHRLPRWLSNNPVLGEREMNGMKLNKSGFRPPLCTYRLNWARRTSWGWWDDWDDTVLQTQDPKFEPWRSEAENATSRSRRLPTILTFTREWGRNIFVSFKPPRQGTEPRTLAWKAAVLTTTLGPPPCTILKNRSWLWHWIIVGLMLGHHLQRWPSIKPALDRRLWLLDSHYMRCDLWRNVAFSAGGGCVWERYHTPISAGISVTWLVSGRSWGDTIYRMS